MGLVFVFQAKCRSNAVN